MIKPAGLKNEMDKEENPFHLIDARDSAMYQEKHIPGAINVVQGDPVELDKALSGDKDDVIVFYLDHEGQDAEVEAIGKRAEEAGFTKVHALKGGLMAWMEGGRALEFGTES